MKPSYHVTSVDEDRIVDLGLRVRPPIPPVATKFLGWSRTCDTPKPRRPAGKSRHVSFRISSSEIDAYMGWSLKASPRPGLEFVTVKIFPHNYVSTSAIVDFDAVEKWKPGTIPGILRPILNGKKSI